MVGALAGPISFRMLCLYHDGYGPAISNRRGNPSRSSWPNLGSQSI